MTDKNQTTNAVEILKQRYIDSEVRAMSVFVEYVNARLEALEYRCRELAEALPQPRPWRVIGKDGLPDSDRLVVVTFNDTVLRKRGREIWRWSDGANEWYDAQGNYGEKNSGNRALAWQNLPEPWRGEVEK